VQNGEIRGIFNIAIGSFKFNVIMHTIFKINEKTLFDIYFDKTILRVTYLKIVG